jgi:hypothetical protein
MPIEELQYIEYEYPCVDQYLPGQEFQTNEQLAHSFNLSSSALSSNAMTKLRAAFLVEKLWSNGQDIRVAFMDGTDHQKEFVQRMITDQLESVVNLNFIWDSIPESSDIRISFALPGQAWSLLGTDAQQYDKSKPTMNFGWLDDDKQFNGNEKLKNTGTVVLHEFGHAMGMIHEHQNPEGNTIDWNKPVVIESLKASQGWDEQQIEHNMFKKYGCEGCEELNGSTYDPFSIMHYFFPSDWVNGGIKLPLNVEYSAVDKKWLAQMYPGRDIVIDTETETDVDGSSEVIKVQDDDKFTEMVDTSLVGYEFPDEYKEILRSNIFKSMKNKSFESSKEAVAYVQNYIRNRQLCNTRTVTEHVSFTNLELLAIALIALYVVIYLVMIYRTK